LIIFFLENLRIEEFLEDLRTGEEIFKRLFIREKETSEKKIKKLSIRKRERKK